VNRIELAGLGRVGDLGPAILLHEACEKLRRVNMHPPGICETSTRRHSPSVVAGPADDGKLRDGRVAPQARIMTSSLFKSNPNSR
jgi:hypothetical protein